MKLIRRVVVAAAVIATAMTAPPTAASAPPDADQFLEFAGGEIDGLEVAVADLQAAIASGDVEAAKHAYAAARPFYERVEPLAASFVLDGRDLAAAIDRPAAEPTDAAASTEPVAATSAHPTEPTAPGELVGFARIEYGLWVDASTAGLDPIAATLSADVADLGAVVDGFQSVDPAELLAGAANVLDEALCCVLTGDVEPHSELAVAVIVANVDGAERAYAAVRDGLLATEPDLVAELDIAFADLATLLDQFFDSEQIGGYFLFSHLTDEHRASLTAAIGAVATPMSAAATAIGSRPT